MAILFFISACSNEVIHNDATISFVQEQHDFGILPYKKETIYYFEFSNIGKTPLLVFDVKTSCGCTVPEWPKEPIIPGRKGFIKINYNTSFPAVFHKTILVFYNGKDSPCELKVKGEVDYPK